MPPLLLRPLLLTGWAGQITYDESTFRGHIRHLYEFQGGPEEVQDTLSRATGVRLVLQEGVVVDEFEAYTRESLDGACAIWG